MKNDVFNNMNNSDQTTTFKNDFIMLKLSTTLCKMSYSIEFIVGNTDIVASTDIKVPVRNAIFYLLTDISTMILPAYTKTYISNNTSATF